MPSSNTTFQERRNDFIWVEGNSVFEELCHAFSRNDWIILDTEFVRETTYYAIPGLLQFSDGKQNWLVDPLTISNWIPLEKLLNSKLLWVMHACNEDLEVLQRLAGATPKNLFDTQVAAQFVGMGHAIGYQKLILELTDILLDKGESRSNWIKRPLTDKQMFYATNDVYYLAQIWQQLEQLLEQKNLSQYFYEDMQVVSNWQAVDIENTYLKVKLAWQLQQQNEVNRLQALSSWRELQAQLKDKPKRHILSDESLLEIARENPKNLEDLKHKGLLHSRQLNAIGEQLLVALDATEQAQFNYPSIKRSIEIPGSKSILKQWKNVANEIASNHHLPPSILFTNSLLDSFFKYSVGLDSSTPKMWTGWRDQFLNQALTNILKNEHLL